MEILFTDLKEKEVVNVYDGKKLGRIIDLVFDIQTGKVIGIVVPGERKIFRRADDIFVPLEKLKRIGDDVILVGIQVQESTAGYGYYSPNMSSIETQNAIAVSKSNKKVNKGQSQSNYNSYIRFHRVPNKKYR